LCKLFNDLWKRYADRPGGLCALLNSPKMLVSALVFLASPMRALHVPEPGDRPVSVCLPAEESISRSVKKTGTYGVVFCVCDSF